METDRRNETEWKKFGITGAIIGLLILAGFAAGCGSEALPPPAQNTRVTMSCLNTSNLRAFDLTVNDFSLQKSVVVYNAQTTSDIFTIEPTKENPLFEEPLLADGGTIVTPVEAKSELLVKSIYKPWLPEVTIIERGLVMNTNALNGSATITATLEGGGNDHQVLHIVGKCN